MEKHKAEEHKLQSEEHFEKHEGEHKFNSTPSIAAPNAQNEGTSTVGIKLAPLNTIEIQHKQDWKLLKTLDEIVYICIFIKLIQIHW